MLSKLFRPTNFKRILFFILVDSILSILTLYLAFLLRFNFEFPQEYLGSFIKAALVLIPLKILFFFAFHIYFVVWRFFGFVEYKKLLYAHLAVYGLFTLIFYLFHPYFIPFPRSVIGIDLFLSFVLLGMFRISKRFFSEKKHTSDKKAIVYGVDKQTSMLIQSARDLEIEYSIEAIVDENERYIGNYFSGIPVFANEKLESLIKRHNITTILLAKELPQKELSLFVHKMRALGVKEIKKTQILQDNDTVDVKSVSIEDLLARHPKDLDTKAIEHFIENKTVLITGAGGSIGSQLARQCAQFKAKKILLLDHSEFNLYQIEQELQDYPIVPILQNVTEKELLQKTFSNYSIDIVLHAAAYKHVPLCEENVQEAIWNNIIGTKNVIDFSIEHKVEKFVLISTDKAVRPTNVMGATKRVCELYAQNVPANDTEIVAVRFGNVLGSSGSVIPKFKKQIEQGGPLTVTHPEITRYFMLIPEACQLVLQAATLGQGGEVFVLDMGEPVKIVDLAKKMCELSGREDIEITFTGLRPGEKLYEELLLDETQASTKYESIMIARPTYFDIETLRKKIDELLTVSDKIKKLQEIVPEFHHKKH